MVALNSEKQRGKVKTDVNLKAEAEKQLWLLLKALKHLSFVCKQQISNVSCCEESSNRHQVTAVQQLEVEVGLQLSADWEEPRSCWAVPAPPSPRLTSPWQDHVRPGTAAGLPSARDSPCAGVAY